MLRYQITIDTNLILPSFPVETFLSSRKHSLEIGNWTLFNLKTVFSWIFVTWLQSSKNLIWPQKPHFWGVHTSETFWSVLLFLSNRWQNSYFLAQSATEISQTKFSQLLLSQISKARTVLKSSEKLKVDEGSIEVLNIEVLI